MIVCHFHPMYKQTFALFACLDTLWRFSVVSPCIIRIGLIYFSDIILNELFYFSFALLQNCQYHLRYVIWKSKMNLFSIFFEFQKRFSLKIMYRYHKIKTRLRVPIFEFFLKNARLGSFLIPAIYKPPNS